MRLTFGRLAWLLPALAAAVSGCARPKPDAAQDHAERCAKGERMACVRACQNGVYGKSGCMAAVHDKNPVRRTKMLTAACNAREADACRLAAEASIALNLGNPLQYQSLLSLACDQHDRAGCEKLGDFRLLESLPSAKTAYEKACSLQPERKETCLREVTERIAAIDRERAQCQKNDLAACEGLLQLTALRNHDLAYQGAEGVCRLRGLNQHYRKTELRYDYKLRKRFATYERCGLFLLARAADEPRQSLTFQRVPVPESGARANQPLRGRVDLTNVAFHFRDAPSVQPERVSEFKAQITARLRERLTLAARCYDHHLSTHPGTQGTLNATFIVDKLGEPLEARASGELADLELQSCLLSAAIPERFGGIDADLGSVARVEASLGLTPVDAAKR